MSFCTERRDGGVSSLPSSARHSVPQATWQPQQGLRNMELVQHGVEYNLSDVWLLTNSL